MAYQYYVTPDNYSTALQHGISANLLTKRVRDYAWSIERATTKKPQQKNKWNGWLEVAKQNNIVHATFHTRMFRDGMSPEKAATTPLMSNIKTLEKMTEGKRKYQKEYRDLAKENGISIYTFGDRMRRGWTLMESATRPLMTKAEASALANKSKLRNYRFGRGITG